MRHRMRTRGLQLQESEREGEDVGGSIQSPDWCRACLGSAVGDGSSHQHNNDASVKHSFPSSHPQLVSSFILINCRKGISAGDEAFNSECSIVRRVSRLPSACAAAPRIQVSVSSLRSLALDCLVVSLSLSRLTDSLLLPWHPLHDHHVPNQTDFNLNTCSISGARLKRD